jgi:hypothetical protein
MLVAAMPARAQSSGAVLRFVPHADLSIIDPHWTGVYITRNYGDMVYDTLFALDNAYKPQPQMVETGPQATTGSTGHFACATISRGTRGRRCTPPISSPR